MNSNYDVSFEMMSTDINSDRPERFKATEVSKRNRIFSDFIPGYDIAYWQNENIILPEEDINKVLQGLKKEDFKIIEN